MERVKQPLLRAAGEHHVMAEPFRRGYMADLAPWMLRTRILSSLTLKDALDDLLNA
jgi:hypothetical protein